MTELQTTPGDGTIVEDNERGFEMEDEEERMINVCADCSPTSEPDDTDVTHCERCGQKIFPEGLWRGVRTW